MNKDLVGNLLLVGLVSCIIAMVLLFGMMVGKTFDSVMDSDAVQENTIAENQTYIRIQDIVFYPSEVSGFTIQKYAIATYDESPVFEYAVKICGPDLFIQYGTFEEAEKVMIELAGECGI